MKTYAFDFTSQNQILAFADRDSAESWDENFVLAQNIHDLNNADVDIREITTYYNNLSTIPVDGFKNRKIAVSRLFALAQTKAIVVNGDMNMARFGARKSEYIGMGETVHETAHETAPLESLRETMEDVAAVTTGEAREGAEAVIASIDATSEETAEPVDDAPEADGETIDEAPEAGPPTQAQMKAAALTAARARAEELMDAAIAASEAAARAEADRAQAQATIAEIVRRASTAIAAASAAKQLAMDSAAMVASIELRPLSEFVFRAPLTAATGPRLAGSGKRGRTSTHSGKTLTLREGQKTNPRREGSRAYASFNIVLNAADEGKSIKFEDYIAQGGHVVDLARDIKEDYVITA